MPRYPAEKGANVRRWLSDSSVKYVRDSGPYEKNLIKSILNSKNLPHEDIIFQCLFETTNQTTPINIIEARDLQTKTDRFVTLKIVCKRLQIPFKRNNTVIFMASSKIDPGAKVK